MALQVRFSLTRSDNSAEFWWNSTDNEILNYCNQIKSIAQSLNIQHSYSESEDGLTANSTFLVSSLQNWLDLNQRISDELPTMFSKRSEYFSANNHTLTVEWFDDVLQRTVLRNNNILTQSVTNDTNTIY
jgi:hypothetical protein